MGIIMNNEDINQAEIISEIIRLDQKRYDRQGE